MKRFRKESFCRALTVVAILVLVGFLFTACSEKATTESKGDALKKLGSLQDEDEAVKSVQENKPQAESAEKSAAPAAAPAQGTGTTKSQ
ncbi:MAG: hypothetical protein AB1659_02455 [Thermodesulfobacteriota bacterium]